MILASNKSNIIKKFPLLLDPNDEDKKNFKIIDTSIITMFILLEVLNSSEYSSK